MKLLDSTSGLFEFSGLPCAPFVEALDLVGDVLHEGVAEDVGLHHVVDIDDGHSSKGTCFIIQ
jgi:hypothetical protein